MTQRLIPTSFHFKELLPKTHRLEISSPEHFTKMVVRPFKSFKCSQHETDGKMQGFFGKILRHSNVVICLQIKPQHFKLGLVLTKCNLLVQGI